MLTTLRIKNFALVADLTVEFQKGLNVITGETGAGKSILIGALNLILGQRADRTMIRSDCDACTVEAVFVASVLGARLDSFLEENALEPCEDGQLLIKRTISGSGANKQFINGSPTTLNVLSGLGDLLVDIHGPHDHQSLLNPGQQLAILDAFGGLENEREAIGRLVRGRAALKAEKAALIVDEKTYAQQLDLLRFQVNEISAARLKPDEQTELEAEYQRSSHAARLLELTEKAAAILSNDEPSLLTSAGLLGRMVQEIARVDPGASPLASAHQTSVDALRELQGELAHYSERLQIDPQRLSELEERVNLLHSLKRKYGSTVAEVIAFGEEAQKKLQSLEQRDAEVERLNARLHKLDAELLSAGEGLSARRRKVIPQLARAVVKELSALGFKQCHFDVAISTGKDLSEVAASGFDTVEFQFAPNLGEPPRPLRAIASSGELARVMLGLKSVLAAVDSIPVLVFDEVDANVGGETANAVGEKMRQISQKRQVLCITHLPQVACHATAHYVVSKTVKTGRTISEVALLNSKERITEVARMLGGQTDAARKHAAALLAQSA